MTTIRLGLKKPAEFQIEAKTIPTGGSGPDYREGNVETQGGTAITWKAKLGGTNEASKYTVTFRDLRNGDPVWPFVEYADGTGVAPQNYLGPLVLPYGPGNDKSVSLTTRSLDVAAKYVVIAEPPGNATIDDLDPIIIIRQQSSGTSNVALGVTCAVLGAVGGALVTALLL